jgi:hypothetical protein
MNAHALRAALLGALLTGCTSGATLSLSAQAESGDGPDGPASAQSLDLGNGIVLDEVWMVVRRIELEGGDRFGPYPVVVAGEDLVSGTLSWQFDVSVPPGTYDALEIQVNTIPAVKAGDDPVLQAMVEAHASVIVTGTLDEEPFTFATPVAFTQEREPFEVPEEGIDVTLQFDPSSWFVDGSGNRLDPRDPWSWTEINRNIRDSLRLFQDDELDGCDDGCEDEDDGSP